MAKERMGQTHAGKALVGKTYADSPEMSRRTFLSAMALAALGASAGLAGCASRSTTTTASDGANAADDATASHVGSADQSADVASTTDTTSATSNGDNQSTQSNSPAGTDGTKPLVVYFSYTGNVDKMAHWIANETGGDLVRVTAKDAYSDNYDATVDRAKKELDEGARPEITVELDANQLAGYNTVFFGFPIWWYDLPTPMCTFLESYDLSGKEVVPFFSHGGSASGANSLTTLESLAKGATVRSDDVISILGDNVAQSEQEVRDWVKDLGFSA